MRALLLLLVSLSHLGSLPAEAQDEEENQKIKVYETKEGVIYISNLDGSGERKLTDGYSAILSQDQRHVTFRRNGDLYLLDLKTMEEKTLLRKIRSDSDRERRIAGKLGIGALWGIVPSSMGLFMTAVAGNTDGLGARAIFEFSVLFGFPVGAAVGVNRVDPYDRLLHALAGSAMGFAIGLGLTAPHNYLIDSRWETWPLYVFPLAGATIASELGRDPNESRRFSIEIVPSHRAFMALAKLKWGS